MGQAVFDWSVMLCFDVENMENAREEHNNANARGKAQRQRTNGQRNKFEYWDRHQGAQQQSKAAEPEVIASESDRDDRPRRSQASEDSWL